MASSRWEDLSGTVAAEDFAGETMLSSVEGQELMQWDLIDLDRDGCAKNAPS